MFVKAQWVAMSTLVLSCMYGIVCGESVDDSCFCGYGGVCRFSGGKAMKWNCSACEDISGGLYQNCTHLADHCKSNPCMNNGVCFMTFGSFYCQCPIEFIGHTCRFRRTDVEKDVEAVVAPRTWFQVNRIGQKVTQLVYFTFERPGDNMRIDIRYDDGRFINVAETQLKLANAKQECIQDVNQNPQERDIRVCETLPDRNVYMVKLDPRFFDSYDEKDLPMKKVKLSVNGKEVTEGRVNEMHIAVINKHRLTFSQVYRIHTSFELEPMCKFRISFNGCSKLREINILHDRRKPIYLQAIREPLDDCSVGVVEETIWELPGKPPIISPSKNFSLKMSENEAKPGRNFIDFLLTVRGRPPYYGGNDLSYNYARCWFKVVMGHFRVGVKGGESRRVPCETPLTLRLESFNKNFRESEFDSMWRCEPASLRNCKLKRFLGSKIFFRSFPCGLTIKFRSMIVHQPTGNKYYLKALVKTSIHIDTLQCRCEYNCEHYVDPRSKIRFWADEFRLSTDSDDGHIEWTANLSGERFDIARFVTSETMGKGVEIDVGSLTDFNDFFRANPVLGVRAQRRNLFCSMELVIDVPPTYAFVQLRKRYWLADVEDERFELLVLNTAFSRFVEPLTFEAREILGPGDHETVETVRAELREFRYLKMSHPTYVIAKNKNGLESRLKEIFPVKAKPKRLSLNRLRQRICVISKLLSRGSYEVAVTEIMYCTQEIMVQKRHFLPQKTALLAALNEAIKQTLATSTVTVLTELTRILHIINRVNLSPELARPPFNIKISPWVVPRRLVYPAKIMEWSELCNAVAITVQTVSEQFFAVSSEDGTTRFSDVLRLLFHSLLRCSLALLRREYYRKRIDVHPDWKLRYKNDDLLQRACFDESVYYMQKAIDHHVDSYTGEIQTEIGTTTIYGLVFAGDSASQVAKKWFNKIQQVRVRINITDETIISSSTTLFFSIYVEIPFKDEITTRAHICLVTHQSQNKVNATIEVQMQLKTLGGNGLLTTAYIRSPEFKSNDRKFITTYKLKIISGLHPRADRQISLRIKSQDEVKLHVDRELPQYEEVYTSPTRGRGSFNVSMVTNQSVVYLSLAPGQDVPSGVPTRMDFDLDNTACAVHQPIRDSTAVLSDYGEDFSKDCSIAQPHYLTPVSHITCVCSGDGVFVTYRADTDIDRVLPAPSNEDNGILSVERGLLWIIPVILFIVCVTAWRRDRSNEKKEYIQSLEDTFPGDSHPYIVGVYTGNRLFASTRAKVAMQIFGVSAKSRIHILQTRSFKALGRGQDDWFIVYTKEHLGRLTHITLWHDLEKLWPAWYCTKILIYDFEQTLWFRFTLNRWIGLLSEGIQNARIIDVHGAKFYPEIESIISFSFLRHYLRVLRNVHSVMSLFFKQRRHMHSYKLRAASFVILTLPVVSTVMFLDGVLGQNIPALHSRILRVANFAVLFVSAVALVRTYFVGMSMAKTRKTRKLDLRRVKELKAAAKEDYGLTKKTMMVLMEDNLNKKSSPEEVLQQLTSKISTSPTKNIYKPENQGSGYEKHLLPGPEIEDKKPPEDLEKLKRSTEPISMADDTSLPRKSSYARRAFSRSWASVMKTSKHSSPDRNLKSLDSTWIRHRKCTSLFKWLPDAAYRPIRFANKRSYIRYGGRGYQIAQWTLTVLLVVAATAYFLYHTIVLGYHGEHTFSILLTAMAFMWFFYEPLLYFLMSILTVYYAKWGNLECHILELGGLPENEKRINHRIFLSEVTQPSYHPQKTEKLERLYKKYCDRSNFLLYAFILLLLIFFLVPWIIVMNEKDIQSIWRLKNFTRNVFLEPTANDHPGPPELLDNVHSRYGIRTFMASVFFPATNTEHWYSNEKLKLTEGYGFFVDRSSKRYGATILRLLSASNRTKSPIHPVFRQYYKDPAYYNFDKYSNYTTLLSDWSTVVHKSQAPWPILERVLNNGLYGKSGLFYPQFLGTRVLFSRGVAQNLAEIIDTVDDYYDEKMRALIIDFSLIHPSFSSSFLNPTQATTRIQILFEYTDAGPISASVHTSFAYANPSRDKVRFLYLAAYASTTTFFVAFITIRMCFKGVTACLKEFRGLTVTVIAFLSFTNFLFLLVDTLFMQRWADMEFHPYSYTNYSFLTSFLQICHRQFTATLGGCLLLSMCVLLVELVNDAIGFLKKGYEKRFLLLPLLAYILALYCSFVVKIALKSNGAEIGTTPLLRVYKRIECKDCNLFVYFYACISVIIVGVTMSSQILGFEQYPCDQVIKRFPLSYVCPCVNESKEVPTRISSSEGDTRHPSIGKEGKKGSEEKKRTEDSSQKTISPVAEDKLRIFRLWG